jgi:hypothetical protein
MLGLILKMFEDGNVPELFHPMIGHGRRDRDRKRELRSWLTIRRPHRKTNKKLGLQSF